MKLPNSWAELSPVQVLSIAPLLLQKRGVMQQIAVLEALLTPEQVYHYAKMSPEEISILLPEVKKWWQLPLEKPIIGSFMMNDRQYLMPDERLYHCCFVEFIHAESIFQQLIKNPSDEQLVDRLILSLCRPQRQDVLSESPEFDGDYRERFNPELIQGRMDKAQFSNEFRAYFLLFFHGCMTFIHGRYPRIFKNTEAAAPKGFGWTGVVYDIADKGTFGTALNVKYSPLYNVLTYLDKCQYDFIQWKNSQK